MVPSSRIDPAIIPHQPISTKKTNKAITCRKLVMYLVCVHIYTHTLNP